MKVSSLLVGVSALAQAVSAHYFFDTTIRNGAPDRAWRYVRNFTRQTKYNPIKFSTNPASDLRDGSTIDGPDSRCNQGAASFGSSTEVLEVRAGTEVRLRVANGGDTFHPGPSLVYLSRAPGDNVRNYDGSGDWFKIYEDGICNPNGDFTAGAWCSFERSYIAATIPADTPNGEYLFRAEHIGVHRSHVSQPEHYVSCAQIRVTGGGNGSPGPMVKFPGAYRPTDPYATVSIYGSHKTFTIPGPAVWRGGGGGGGSGSCSALYGQCGGQGYNGPTCCSSGRCVATNQWYSQCV